MNTPLTSEDIQRERIVADAIANLVRDHVLIPRWKETQFMDKDFVYDLNEFRKPSPLHEMEFRIKQTRCGIEDLEKVLNGLELQILRMKEVFRKEYPRGTSN